LYVALLCYKNEVFISKKKIFISKAKVRRTFPCFVIKTKFLLAKGKEAWLVFLGACFAFLLIF